MAKSLPSVVFLQLSAEFDSKSYAEFNATSPLGFVFLLWKITCRRASLKSVLWMIPILLSFVACRFDTFKVWKYHLADP